LTNETNNALVALSLGIFAVAAVAGGVYLAKKMKEAKEAEQEVPPPAGTEVPYEPVE
jgi:hypothetical protein